MFQHRGFPRRTTTDRLVCALSLAPSRAPPGRERERARGGQPASTARRPARSERPAGYARSCPARTAGPCPGRLSPRTRAAVWRAPAQAAPSPGTRKPARGATDGDTRWRRGHIHFSPERALAVRRAPACPEWSVASDAEGGMRRAGRAVPNQLSTRVRRSVTQPASWWTQKGRGRLGRPPTPQAPQVRGAQRGSRDAERPRAFEKRTAVVAGLPVTGRRARPEADYSSRSSTNRKPFTYVTESPYPSLARTASASSPASESVV
jgi:hypothetical protein